MALLLISFVFNIGFFVKLIYPIEYGKEISIYAKEYDVDPFLILSIMKVESGFDPNVISSKGAIGLMQIMPETGEWIAKTIDDSDFTKQDLYDPNTNIRFGTWYISKLFQTFNENLTATVAAYNGGEGNVAQWIKNGKWSGQMDDLDSIPFEETFNYVKSVHLVYTIYEKLYGYSWPYL